MKAKHPSHFVVIVCVCIRNKDEMGLYLCDFHDFDSCHLTCFNMATLLRNMKNNISRRIFKLYNVFSSMSMIHGNNLSMIDFCSLLLLHHDAPCADA